MVAGCGGNKPKRDMGETRPGGTTGGEQGGAGEGGAQDRGTVGGEDMYGLKTIYFDFDEYNLRSDARAALDANAKVLQDDPEMKIVIEGHCDERGTDEYNLALGERRAQAAKDYLVRLGVDAARVSIISFGETRPAAPGHDEDSWALNRRGDFLPR